MFLCAAVGFLTFGLQPVLCPSSDSLIGQQSIFDETTHNMMGPQPVDGEGIGVVIQGHEFAFNGTRNNLGWFGKPPILLGDEWRGADISKLFPPTDDQCPPSLRSVAAFDCSITNPITGSSLPGPGGQCAQLSWILPYNIRKTKRIVDWDELKLHTEPPHALMVYNNYILNLTEVLFTNSSGLKLSSDVKTFLTGNVGKDASMSVRANAEMTGAVIKCLMAKYQIGYVGQASTGCMASTVIQNISLVIILGVVLTRFFMAIYFYWFMSGKLTKPRPTRVAVRSNQKRSRFSSPVASPMPAGEDDDDMHTLILVTCYSEGEEGIRTTLNSLASTTYPDDKKLLFVVADGMITGSGNTKSTPDIILGMIDQDESLPPPDPKSYVAIAHGNKQHNCAKVYAGTYTCDGHTVPIVLVVKVGNSSEIDSPKPGNRGKRDSQLVLMNFLSRIMFDDRMTPLDYELFYRIQHVATTADKYEVVLMVDADTKVAPDSLDHMTNAMRNDVAIMGLCGETRIANKTASWTSAMQVFEYYISHHLGKAFESVFGGVTCLPGCFSMYRIKAPKGYEGSWVPILVNPDIVDEYSENVVDTLHKKNLLLLGEDRFLSTLMLRNFPKRKMIFVPQAICWTMVPEQFKVLLSQRRRWINSTIHNLLELVLVRDLCGIFCFSMQFVVLLELIGTVVLPAAISFTLYLIISAIIKRTAELIPFLMLAAILGLPGFLIIVTTRKIVYVLWMFVYLISLPLWNFVLPAYAFWHFDDFSWGETRKVEGEQKGDDHGKKEGQFESGAVVMKKWIEWERDQYKQSNKPMKRRQMGDTSSQYMIQAPTQLPPDPRMMPNFMLHPDPALVGERYPVPNVRGIAPNPYLPHGMAMPPPNVYGMGFPMAGPNRMSSVAGFGSPYAPQPPPPPPHLYGVSGGSKTSFDALLQDKGKRRESQETGGGSGSSTWSASMKTPSPDEEGLGPDDSFAYVGADDRRGDTGSNVNGPRTMHFPQYPNVRLEHP
ncbi:Chitin synthase, class 3 [Rhizophlyctis rosea]|nr:Chitin synthase, class 3 [Rhizophlyctis rosea]